MIQAEVCIPPPPPPPAHLAPAPASHGAGAGAGSGLEASISAERDSAGGCQALLGNCDELSVTRNKRTAVRREKKGYILKSCPPPLNIITI